MDRKLILRLVTVAMTNEAALARYRGRLRGSILPPQDPAPGRMGRFACVFIYFQGAKNISASAAVHYYSNEVLVFTKAGRKTASLNTTAAIPPPVIPPFSASLFSHLLFIAAPKKQHVEHEMPLFFFSKPF